MSELDIPTADPADIRAEADRILDRPEFRDERSFIERGLDWIGEQLGRLIPDGAVGGGLSGLVTIILIGLGLVVLGLGLRALGRMHRERTSRRRPSGLAIVLGEAVDPVELDAAVRTAEASGDWTAALLARYRLMVATLVGHGVLSDFPGRTTGEYRLEMADGRPDQSAEFDAATTTFEWAYYGAAVMTSEDVKRLETHATVVLGSGLVRS